jgi:exonuclease III
VVYVCFQLLSVLIANLINHYKFMSCNVRGMNSLAQQEEIKQFITIIKPVICLQETKMVSSNYSVIRNVLGSDYENNFIYLPANGRRGGVLIAASESLIQIQNPVLTSHTISATMVDSRHNLLWTFISVYGPQGALDKKMFIRELKNLKQPSLHPWLILGDINIIYKDVTPRVMVTLITVIRVLTMHQIHWLIKS